MAVGEMVIGCMLTLAIIGTGIWAWTPDRSRCELEKKYWDPTRYIEVGGTSIRVRATGNSSAPAVILLHGSGSSVETWEPWAQSLSARYRVVRPIFLAPVVRNPVASQLRLGRLTVRAIAGGVFGALIEINQLRHESAKPCVAQPYR